MCIKRNLIKGGRKQNRWGTLQEWGKLGTGTEDEVHLGDIHTREDNINIDFQGIGYRMDLS